MGNSYGVEAKLRRQALSNNEQVSASNINEHAVSKNVSAYEALDVLTLKQRFQDGRV
jgi:hypothetical protein